MKIDLNTNYPVFRKRAGQLAAKADSAQADRSAKTDVVDFSRSKAAAPGKELAALRSNLLRDVAAPASADHLSALQERIQTGSYHPSTDALVDAILGKD